MRKKQHDNFKIEVNSLIKKKINDATLDRKKNCNDFVSEAIICAKIWSDSDEEPISKNLDKWLQLQNYKASSKIYSEANIGDVALINVTCKCGNYECAHLQVFCDDQKWRSCSIQTSFYSFDLDSNLQHFYIIYE